ncbi:MAG: ATP-binding protein [Actinomycetota bacterium]|nr:PAS domain S-box protein [Actinomycetota bacterium]
MELIERQADGVIVVGGDRSIVSMNRAAERITGWSRAEGVGRFWGDVVRLRDPSGFLVHERADPFLTASPVASGSPEREYLLSRRDGPERWVAVRTSYTRDERGALVEVVASIRDVGRRHRLERSAYDLIATLAHDLRSPLTSVKGFTATLMRNWDRFTEEQKLHMLKTIDWDADRMNRLLKDLLDLSRLEAGRLELRKQEVDLGEIAHTVVERLAMDHEKTHTFRLDVPVSLPKVPADPGKVEQVLVNLLENAAKHGDPGPISVTGVIEDGSVVVRVSDSGPGVDPRHVPYLFTKFYRQGTGDRHAGTGLGLYICKGIIEAHGGDIAVEKTGPSGTVFAFTLPLEDG